MTMAAPFKKGLDYWSRPIDFGEDNRLIVPRKEYGYSAVNVDEILLDILFKNEGYFIDYSNKNNVIWDIQKRLQGKYQPQFEVIERIIECLVACGLFSGDQFKHEIITSRWAQKVYYKATVPRKSLDINFNIWLLNEDDMKDLSTLSTILKKYINRPNNPDNRPNYPDNLLDNPESKVKQIILDDEDARGNLLDSIEAFISDFERIYYKTNEVQKSRLIDMYERYGLLRMNDAFEETAKRPIRDPIAYMEVYLRNEALKEASHKNLFN
jgi:hypothetical protein